MRVVHRAGAKPVAPRLHTLRRGVAVFPAPQGRVGGIGGAHTGLRASEAFKHPPTAERPGGPDTLPYDSVVPTPWFRELRQLHDENFREDWTSHVSALNRELGLTGPDAFGVPARGLSPPWFVGDVEAVPPRQWVLVISLNQARREEDEEWHLAQHYTEQTYWDHWRWLNKDDHWNPRFYRPFVRLAAQAMGVEMHPEMEQEFATTRMVFAELCPYSSRRFGHSDADVHRLTAVDGGFRVAARIRHVLMEEGRPGLVMINGVPAIAAFERVHGDQMELAERRSYASVRRSGKKLWHREGHVDAAGGRVPLLAFPFLRTRQTHNSYSEIAQLAAMGREHVRRHRARR